jgi:hypothetical protein
VPGLSIAKDIADSLTEKARRGILLRGHPHLIIGGINRKLCLGERIVSVPTIRTGRNTGITGKIRPASANSPAFACASVKAEKLHRGRQDGSLREGPIIGIIVKSRKLTHKARN